MLPRALASIYLTIWISWIEVVVPRSSGPRRLQVGSEVTIDQYFGGWSAPLRSKYPHCHLLGGSGHHFICTCVAFLVGAASVFGRQSSAVFPVRVHSWERGRRPGYYWPGRRLSRRCRRRSWRWSSVHFDYWSWKYAADRS